MRIHTFLCLVTLIILAGCAHEAERLNAASPYTEIEQLPEIIPEDTDRPPFKAGPGDILTIQVSGLPTTRYISQVGIDGSLVYPPGACTLSASGKTLAEIAQDLTTACSTYFREPLIELSINKVASTQCVVLGEVTQPGTLPLIGDERILDVISKAGGMKRTSSWHDTANTADLQHALYVRGDKLIPINFTSLIEHGDQRYNIRVHPNDYVFIPSTLNQEIFILGAVNSPGMYRMRSDTTIAKALALAGGHTRDAYIDRAMLIRGTRTKPTAGNIDIKAIITGRAPDILLIRGDILYLPGRTSENPRFWLDTFNNSLVTTATSRYASDLYDRVRGNR